MGATGNLEAQLRSSTKETPMSLLWKPASQQEHNKIVGKKNNPIWYCINKEFQEKLIIKVKQSTEMASPRMLAIYVFLIQPILRKSDFNPKTTLSQKQT